MRPLKAPNNIIHHHSSLFYLFSRCRLRGWGTAGKPAESDANRVAIIFVALKKKGGQMMLPR